MTTPERGSSVASISSHPWQILIICTVILSLVNGKPQDSVKSNGFLKQAASQTFSNQVDEYTPVRHRRAINGPKDIELLPFLNDLDFLPSEVIGESGFLFPQPHYHDRAKRVACWGGGGYPGAGGAGGAGGTGGGSGLGGDGGDLDVVERRRKAARKRAAQKRKSKKTTRKTKKIVNNDEEVAMVDDQGLRRRRRKRDAEKAKEISEKARQIVATVRDGFEEFMETVRDVAQSLKENTRKRKRRQAEVDDLNNGRQMTTTNSNKDFSQIAESLRNMWENLMQNFNQLAQSFKQKFAGTNPANPGGGEEI